MYVSDMPNMDVPALRTMFNERAISAIDMAHLCIDVQKVFVTDDLAAKIAEKLSPVFNRAAIINYLIHFSADYQIDENEMPINRHAFLRVKPLAGDKIIRKTRISAFEGSDIESRLAEDKKKLVVISGVSFCVCVYKTAMDAAKMHDTIVLSDMTDLSTGSRELLREYQCAGVKFTTSDNLFTALGIK